MEPDLLDRLNEQQREAVTHGEGPLLVLAGAGSGKTRVIAHRVAHLIASRQAEPDQVVAVTFTNKAADEMRERIRNLAGTGTQGLQVRTFHSFCLRILRREAHHLDYPHSFVIYDAADQIALIRDILRSNQEAKNTWSAKEISARISSAKNLGVGPGEYSDANRSPGSALLAQLYEEYEKRLRRARAMDFDDLILKSLHLLVNFDAVGKKYAGMCRHLLVDEYQDTNRPQHLLVKRLTGTWGNICVVGDEDQSIYGFRGANIGNILSFSVDFPNARVIKLERNYRSTRRILEAASAVVSRNRERLGKTLWTEDEEGERLDLFEAPTDREEAVWVVQSIRRQMAEMPEGECAVLYRTNPQSRPLEEILNREGIPYRMVGGVRFYERREVKDMLAYLRLLLDPADDVGLNRILNVPPRAIGPAARMGLEEARKREEIPLWDALQRCLEEKRLPARSRRALAAFRTLMEEIRNGIVPERPAEALQSLLDRVSYFEYLRASCPATEAEERIQNINELLSGIAEYDGIEDGLQLFLDQASLIGETDINRGAGRVVLMTIHASKGLEFPAVFLVGMEENLLPHARSLDSDSGIEEERRLFYVGLTRARRRVFLTHAATRRIRGAPEPRIRSRFLDEIPAHLLLDRTAPKAKMTAAPLREQGWVTADRSTGHPYFLKQQVHHPTLGVGTIIGIEGKGEKLKLTISFPGTPIRKILPRYTDLRPVSRSMT
ncbi:MAG: UvrD-helicase domain-containing protein [Acidobacteria bacterium]|nr:UvrD-helicase domain-containing protein [Acidobacteriota bacterium]